MSPTTAASRQWKLPAPLVSLAHNRRGDWAAAAMGDGSIVVIPGDDAGEDPKVIAAHDGVSLSLTQDADDHAFLSGGDDGRLFLIDPAIGTATLLAEHNNKWIDHVAAEPSGQRAYASGKTLYRLDERGEVFGDPLSLPSSIGGLAYSPNGKRLAVAHYGGVSLFWAQNESPEAELLSWKGSHLDPLWSPDGKILLSAMQDCALHGWKIGPGQQTQEAGNEMQMQGYTAKVRSKAFTVKGRYLATGGASQLVCWPFFGGGPWNKEPLALGGADGSLVTQVAPHPRDEMIAAGFDDGRIIFAPLDGRMEIMVHPPMAPHGAGVTGLGWNAGGDSLLAAFESGHLMLFTLASVTRFVRGKFG